ncbi:MAG: UDP-N-acetylmuramate--L-alanine ligase [Acidimicrobiales bacterium]|nr:MAG: UDP-N-acetylmuramate--L-alanine ligase [Actinomycetota bacterium]MBV6508750.1 UDP-N-acetylmuramate--L-alanine ligase [Acidimicrobiales bacterium]RIK06513.1 MAG: UDP-N-acetylmuramate--L-alanine ligase [Acidobacteriota bacterium]
MVEGAPLDLSRPRSIHVIGIGGAGMSAIAAVLADMGHHVTGSDQRPSPALDRLRARGVHATVGHAPGNVGDADVVAVSTAIPGDNSELLAARRLAIPVLTRAEMLAAVSATRRSVAVAGTHGKTTTSAMLALILTQAGKHPSFIIGGDVQQVGGGAAWDRGELFVVEADESDGTFLQLPRFASMVTNVEPDHLEYYGSFEALVAGFRRFMAETPGPVVACGDDPVSAALAEEAGAVTYGRRAVDTYRIAALSTGRAGSRYHLSRRREDLGPVELPVSGAHNALNSAGAVAMAMELGADFPSCRRALAGFAGVARRFEFRGVAEEVSFIDDYAHLPTEVEVALATARGGGWGRVVCVFQPHRYSRTLSLHTDFADSFLDADVLAVTDVYSAGEPPRRGVSGRLIVDSVLERHPWRRVAYVPKQSDVLTYLVSELRPGDLCLTLGAGDLTAIPDEVKQALDRGPE